jgi:hypothetical protein
MKPFTTVATVVFALVAIAQLLRVLLGWELKVGEVLIPFWASGLACLVAATLAVMLWRESGRK